MIRSRRSLVFYLAALSACGSYNSGGSGEQPGGGSPISETGTIRVDGSTPFARAVLVAEAEGAYELRGEYREELLRLAGATVRVTGAEGGGRGGGGGGVLWVSGYEILEIAGERPLVGRLEVRSDGTAILRTEKGESVSLAGVPGGLAEQSGAKVWVRLGPDGVVTGFGVLREGPEVNE